MSRTSVWILGFLHYTLLNYAVWVNHYREVLVSPTSQRTEMQFNQSELYHVSSFTYILTNQNCSVKTTQNSWHRLMKAAWFQPVRPVCMWKPHLHKIGPVGNLGRSLLYKRWAPLCHGGVHFQFTPEASFLWFANSFTWIRSLCFPVPLGILVYIRYRKDHRLGCIWTFHLTLNR